MHWERVRRGWSGRFQQCSTDLSVTSSNPGNRCSGTTNLCVCTPGYYTIDTWRLGLESREWMIHVCPCNQVLPVTLETLTQNSGSHGIFPPCLPQKTLQQATACHLVANNLSTRWEILKFKLSGTHLHYLPSFKVIGWSISSFINW